MSTAHGKLHKQRQLTAPAHHMRVGPSEPERLLWATLRSSQLGTRFRRQVVLLGYIVDFFAPAARLVVEVDGAHHERRRGADKRRDAALAQAGHAVLRLPRSRKRGTPSYGCRQSSSSATCRALCKSSSKCFGASASAHKP